MRNTKAEVLVMFSLLLMLIYLSYSFVSNVFVNGRCETNALKDSRKSRKISQDMWFYSTYPNREPHRNVQFHSRFSVLLKFLACGLPSKCETEFHTHSKQLLFLRKAEPENIGLLHI